MNKILIIIILQLLYMPALTIRTNFLVRNKYKVAAIFGVLEALIYIFGVSLVLSDDDGIYAMLAYASGVGLGILVGGLIESKLAIGDITVSVNIKNKNEKLMDDLRKSGYHFTMFEGIGIDGARYRFDILTCRRKEKELIHMIDSYEPNSFIILSEPRKYKVRESLKLK